MARSSPSNYADAQEEQQAVRTKPDIQGIMRTKNVVHWEMTDGISVIAPEDVIFKSGIVGIIGTIIDIVCKLTGRCGGGGSGGDGCTTITITNPDGSTTTIRHCSPVRTA